VRLSAFVIQVDGKYHTYKPRSDFLVLKSGLPRVTVVISNSPDTVGYHRLLLLGAKHRSIREHIPGYVQEGEEFRFRGHIYRRYRTGRPLRSISE
jgi:hypothetical protein